MAEEITRQSRKRNKTHTNILHNAKRLFEEKGLTNVTIDEIAESADISRSTFFNHFSSLDELNIEICYEEIKDLLSIVNEKNHSGVDNIKQVLFKLVEDTYPYPKLVSSLFIQGILKSDSSAGFSSIHELIKEELSGSVLSTDDFTTDELTALIIGAFFGLIFQKFIKGEAFDNDTNIKNTITKLLNHIVIKED